MEKEAFEILLKFFPISTAILVLGIIGIRALITYLNKRNLERDTFLNNQLEKKDTYFKDLLEKKDVFYRDQLEKKDRLIDIKDQKLEDLNTKLLLLTKENIEIMASLRLMIEKALLKRGSRNDND